MATDNKTWLANLISKSIFRSILGSYHRLGVFFNHSA